MFLSDSFSPDSPDLSQQPVTEPSWRGVFGDWVVQVTDTPEADGYELVTGYRLQPKPGRTWTNDFRFVPDESLTVWQYT